jgi:hypothetical protein
MLSKKTLNKKISYKLRNRKPLSQQEIAERHLYLLLDKICSSVDIQLDDWDVNKDLLYAIIASKKSASLRSWKKYNEYDLSYSLIKKLGIKIDVKYLWFTDIAEHTKQTN